MDANILRLLNHLNLWKILFLERFIKSEILNVICLPGGKLSLQISEKGHQTLAITHRVNVGF